MSRTSRNSYSRAANRVKVVQQLGIPIVDSDTNEAQDIVSVFGAENALACFNSLRATKSGNACVGRAAGDEWKPYASGTNTIFVTKGAIFIDGYQVYLDADYDTAVTGGVSYPLVGGADVFGLLYVDIVFAERDSTADPSIAVPNVGETAVRQVLSMTWGNYEHTTSWEAAFTAITALPVIAEPALWKGHTARLFVAAYKRTAATTNIQSTQIFDLRQDTPAEKAARQVFIKFHKAGDATAAEGNGHNDGLVTWDLTNSRLSIGTRDVTTDADEMLGAASLVMPGSPVHHISRMTNQEYAKTGAGTANGTPLTYDSTYGWSIADGSALGFIAPTATAMKNSMVTRTANFADVYSVNPVPATQNPLAGSQLTVQTLATFGAHLAPGTFILCYRKGRDLIWWNGHVTRGNTSQPVLDDPTQAIGHETQLAVGPLGPTHGSAAWALETGMNYLTSGFGAGAFGLSRTLRAKAQRGVWPFTRGVRKYGTSAEAASMAARYDSDNNLFFFEGDGPGITKIEVNPALSSSRAAADIADIEIRAHRIVIRNATFSGDGASANHRPGYLLGLYAAEVVLENCHFIGSVYVNANKVIVRDCTFAGTGASGWYHWAYWRSGDDVSKQPNAVAQHLYLEGNTLPYSVTTGSAWLVENCNFYVDQDYGTIASVILRPYGAVTSDQTKAVIRHSHWKYANVEASKKPSIDIRNKHGYISVTDCTFREARGVSRAGCPRTAGDFTDHPKTVDNYDGAQISAGNDVPDIWLACAYISNAYGRAATSKTHVSRCDFHMGSVGAGVGAGNRYVTWSAMAIIPVGEHDASVEAFNVTFSDNYVQMFTEAASGSSVWTASAANNPQPHISGFVFHPNVAFSSLFTSFAAGSFHIDGNHFDLGGHTTASHAWRSIIGVTGQGHPLVSRWMDMTSSCVSLASNFGDSCSPTLASGAGGGGSVRITNNMISQRKVAAGTFATALATLSDLKRSLVFGPPAATADVWCFIAIAISSGNVPYVENAALEAFEGAVIAGNTVLHTGFTPHSDGYYSAIFTGFTDRTKVDGNVILLPATNGAVGVKSYRARGHIYANNFITAHKGIETDSRFLGGFGTENFIANNRVDATTRFSGTGYTESFTGGVGVGDNW